MIEIGHRIRTLRKMRKLKQNELAGMIPIGKNGEPMSASFLCNIERGNKRPSIKVAIAIAQALGVSLDDIISVN